MTDTRLAAVEAVAQAARDIAGQLLLGEMTEGDRWSADVEAAYDAMIERMRPAIRALDALPAPTPGETVTLAVWRGPRGNCTLVEPGTSDDQRFQVGDCRLGTVTLAVTP